MTKQGSFKRAVRQRARETGQRYTQALADVEQINRSPFARTRPVAPPDLKAHLETRYGVKIASLAPIDDDPATRPRGSWPGHYPSTLYVRPADGSAWIARVFSSPADQTARVEGDAEILRFLAAHDYPAERLAHEHPVSTFNGSGVIITQFIEGGRPSDEHGRSESATVAQELGDLLGRLHALPAGAGAVARPGGAEETDGGFYVGRPSQDLAAAMSFLAAVEPKVPEAAREKFDWLRDQVETADDAEGLPEALTHSNYHLWSAVGAPGSLSITGWAGVGRGPRLPALAWLLRTTAEAAPDNLTAVLDGYTRHVELTDEELTRLPAVLNLRALWLACLDFQMTVNNGGAPTLHEGWLQPSSIDHANQLAARVTTALNR
ncbi:phosphotransferase [Kribbella sandramycini]|uniref:Phosphotransferase n=1 Tax=Kribbella sandramycini TaxID=60450 RepID=A0A7Y4P456_9ACTN|nr:phosphotransferase [Kribbella sandramycini]MBB6567061.1 aminoglycoside phosphotransferase (APT) family kinase protein [Kribbella sandramycini]NOL44780.1 phosphotransferase [Kribbella sandramycini]